MNNNLFTLLILIFSFSTLSAQSPEEDLIIGSCRAGQIELIENNDNQYTFYLESYRRITNGGWSDRRYNYTIKRANFEADSKKLFSIYKKIDSVFSTNNEAIINLGDKKLIISPTEYSSIDIKIGSICLFVHLSAHLHTVHKKGINWG